MKNQRQKNTDRTCTSGRELRRKKSFHTLGSPFTGGDGGSRGSFRATEEGAATGVQRAKRRNSRTEDRCRPALTSLRGLSAHPPGWVGAGSWGSGFWGQIPGRGQGLAAWRLPERVSAPQLARRESGKKSGPVKEARDHCFGVCEEKGFLPCVPTEGRAQPKWAPETGMSHCYQLRPQRRTLNTNAAAAATKNPVCKRRSLSTPPTLDSLCSPPLPGSRDPGTTSPGEHMACLRLLQHYIGLCHCRLAPHSNCDYCTSPSPQAWVSKSTLISCCFNPLLSGWGTDSWGWPTCRGGAKTKPEPQDLCKQRREREISPCTLRSSGLNPHSQCDVPCICGIHE